MWCLLPLQVALQALQTYQLQQTKGSPLAALTLPALSWVKSQCSHSGPLQAPVMAQDFVSF